MSTAAIMNPNRQPSELRHEDDAALSEFLASLMDYTPTIPDELVEHYLGRSGFQSQCLGKKDADASARKAEAAWKRAEDLATGSVQMNGRELFLHEPWVFDNERF